MNVDTLSNIIEQTLIEPDWDKLTLAEREYARGQGKAFVSLIPYVGGTAAEELQQYYDYKDDEFFRKFVRFLMELKDTTSEERHRFAEEIQQKAEDHPGNVILGMVDRLDNINKEVVMAKLSVARMHGAISIEDFFRLHSLLERIPYVDLKLLPQYTEPFYDESGDTELLYSTGVLELQTLDANGSNKYILSKLGEKLLLWGFHINLAMERSTGTNVALNVATPEEIDEMYDKKMKANRPTYKDGTLYFPDGSKSGSLEDDGQFLYDVARGK